MLFRTKREVWNCVAELQREAVAELQAIPECDTAARMAGYERIKADLARRKAEAWTAYRPYAKKKRVA